MPPTTAPMRIARTHSGPFSTTGRTRKPPWGAGSWTLNIMVRIEAMEEPSIMMGMTGQMFLVMNGMAPSVMWVQPRMRLTTPAS